MREKTRKQFSIEEVSKLLDDLLNHEEKLRNGDYILNLENEIVFSLQGVKFENNLYISKKETDLINQFLSLDDIDTTETEAIVKNFNLMEEIMNSKLERHIEFVRDNKEALQKELYFTKNYLDEVEVFTQEHKKLQALVLSLILALD